ncbi:MAG: helix-turn-helix transcriptional regulator [Nitrosomonadales bacterium]|nr:helix-turn-helix transcriptional regulator [Nitrosomonadales bacterium]
MSQDNVNNTKVKVPEDDLGFRIKLIREQKGLTQEALSILTKYPEIDPEGRGLSRPSIVGYEQGKNLPDARGIRLLATALEVTPSWLLLGQYDEPPEPDPRKALMDALDKYTARRAYDLNPVRGTIVDFMPEPRKKLEGLDPLVRLDLEKKASEEALAKNQEIHKQRSAK